MLIAPIIPPVDPISFGADIIITILGALFGGLFGGGGGGASVQDLNNLRNATASAIDVLKRFTWTLAAAVGALLLALRDIFIDLLDKIKSLLQTIAKALAWVLKTGIPALLKIIRQLRQWLAMIYQKYIRPLLLWIQLARRYLAILRLLHIHIADRLDKVLGQIQGVILAPYLYVLRSINGVGTWINLIVTIGGLIQRPVMFNSLYAYQRDWINMWWTGQSPTGGNGVVPPAPAPYVPETAQDVTAGVAQWVDTGTGEYADYAALTLAAFDDASLGLPLNV
jgi:hypothetical protein